MPAPETLNIQQPGEPAKPSHESVEAAEHQGNTGADAYAAPAYKAIHKGGGKHIIVDANGNQVGDFRGDKAEAAAEIARLLAGGEPLTAAADSANGEGYKPAKARSANVDPTKIKHPVLTDEGWVCPVPPLEG